MSFNMEKIDPTTSACSDSTQVNVINSFIDQSIEANSTSSDDYVAEAKIGLFFQQAAIELQRLQDARIEEMNNTPLFLQNCEDFKQKLEDAKSVNSECTELLNHVACGAQIYNDTGFELATTSCVFGTFTPQSEHPKMQADLAFYAGCTALIGPLLGQIIQFVAD